MTATSMTIVEISDTPDFPERALETHDASLIILPYWNCGMTDDKEFATVNHS